MKTTFAMLTCVLLLGLTGCSTDQTPTEIAAGQPSVSGHDKVPPPTSGPYVVRYQDISANYFYDEARDLQIVFGADLTEYCNGIVDFDIVNLLEITNPVDQDVVVQLMQGRGIHAAVYPLFPFDCGTFLDVGPIASGFVNITSTDNDLYAYLETNTQSRVNSYGMTANGALYTPEGQKVMVNFNFHIVWPGYPDLDQINELTSDIRLAFTGP